MAVIKRMISEMNMMNLTFDPAKSSSQYVFPEVRYKYKKLNDNQKETRVTVLKMLYDVFREMSLSVLRNKYDDTITRDVALPDKVECKVSNGESTRSMNNIDIIDYCMDHECGYNLVTECIEKDEDITVINSVSTDVEILNGMISILSLMLTSNQLLSMSRTYDRKTSRKQLLQTKLEEQAANTKTIVNTVINTLDEAGIISKESMVINQETYDKLKLEESKIGNRHFFSKLFKRK
jgi:hypothetical protein